MTPRKRPEDKLRQGQPTKWKSEINDALVEFFSIAPTREVAVTFIDKKGNETTKFEEKPNRLPTFEMFCAKHDLNGDTIVEWAKPENNLKYPGFSAAYKKAKDLQKDFLLNNAITGLFNPVFSIFVAKNITDMKDRQEVEHSGNAGFILDVKQAKRGDTNPGADRPAA